MIVLQVAVCLFLIMETANVAALYLAPGSRLFNAVGVFDGWRESQGNPDQHDLMRYLVYWVAGTKVIFIALWLVILLVGDHRTQVAASIVMLPAIATFYWRMYPLARNLDRRGKVHPAGYSIGLGWMIAGFLALFAIVTGWALLSA